MTFRGRIKNGVVALDKPSALPEGTEVTERPIKSPKRAKSSAKCVPTLYDRLKPVIGKAVGLPPDAAKNHDHYLSGTPERER